MPVQLWLVWVCVCVTVVTLGKDKHDRDGLVTYSILYNLQYSLVINLMESVSVCQLY